MHCSLCTRSMSTLGHGGVEIDRCTGCGAVWFDPGELAVMLGLAREQETAVQLAPSTEDSVDLPCPRCDAQLREIRVRTLRDRDWDGPGEAVYVCRGCKGVLLSHKALERAHHEGLKAGDIPSDNPDRKASRIEDTVGLLGWLVRFLPW